MYVSMEQGLEKTAAYFGHFWPNEFPDHKLIIVTPVYEDVEASSRLFKELMAQFGRDVFVVAVDDGSVKQPVDITSDGDAGLAGVVLRLRRNVGHQRAIAIGLGYVSEHVQPEQRVVVMNSDVEDLPSTISTLVGGSCVRSS